MKSTLGLLVLSLFALNANAAQVTLVDIVCGAKVNSKTTSIEVQNSHQGKYFDADGVQKFGTIYDPGTHKEYTTVVTGGVINCVKIKSNGVSAYLVKDLAINASSRENILNKMEAIEGQLNSLRNAQLKANEQAIFTASNVKCTCRSAVLSCSAEYTYNHESARSNLTSGLNLMNQSRCESKAKDIQGAFRSDAVLHSSGSASDNSYNYNPIGSRNIKLME